MVGGRLLLGFGISLNFCLLLLLFDFLGHAELLGEDCRFFVAVCQGHLLLQIRLAVNLELLELRRVEVEQVIAQFYQNRNACYFLTFY